LRLAAYQALGINGPPADGQVAQPPAVQPPAQQPPVEEPLRRPSSDIEIQSLPDLDVIILRGRSADVEELTRIINELERISAETTPEIEVYPLQHVRGDVLDELIAEVLENLTGTLQGRVTITPLVKPNALLLIGWGEAVEAARKLIAELDQPVPADSQVRVFPLAHAPAAQLQTTIEQFYEDRTGLAPQFEITADTRTNSLVISASPRDLHELERLVRQLDVAKAQAVNQGRMIRLNNSLAADIAQTLQEAIEAARGGGAGPDATRSAALDLLLVDPQGRRVVSSGLLNDVRITADPRTNTLIVTGPAESMDLIEALVHELDATPAATAQIKVFQIVNGDATEMVLMLRSLFPAQLDTSPVPQLPAAEGETSLVPVRFSVDIRTNSIIATGSASDLRIIEALLARLDAEEAQQRINRVYRLRNSPALDVAAAVNEFLRSERIVQRAAPGRPNPFQQIESEVVVVAEPVGNSLIISASPRFFEEILALVESLDEQPPQVLVQVIIAEVDLSNFHEFGVELGLQDSVLFDRSLLGDLITTTMTTSTSTPSGIVTTTNEVIQAASLTPGFNFNNLPLGNSGSDKSLATASDLAGQALSHFNLGRVNSELGYGGLVLSASSENVSVLLRALDQTSHVEILSRPQIMTLDNQPAFIQVGERVPRIVATSINTIGQVNTVELEDVGLILGLTPRISPEGMVVMDIDAEKSQVGPEAEGIPISVSAEGEIVRSPRVEITRAQTTVSAASGQTVVLGGLITNGNMSISRSVPWLGDIPLLGELFKYDSHRNDRRELLIIMTPHVIRGPQDAEYHKQIEMARMNWCSADFFDLTAPCGPAPIAPGSFDDDDVPVIYPDQTPGLEWRPDDPATDPQHPDPTGPPPAPVPEADETQSPHWESSSLNRVSGTVSLQTPPSSPPTAQRPSAARDASLSDHNASRSAGDSIRDHENPNRRSWLFRLRKNTEHSKR
jgi:type II secretion system protein D